MCLAVIVLLVFLPGIACRAGGHGAEPAADAAAKGSPGKVLTSGVIEGLESAAGDASRNLEPILAAAGDLPHDLGQFAARLTDPTQTSPRAWGLRLVLVLAAGLAAGVVLPAGIARMRRWYLGPRSPAPSRMLLALLRDILGIVLILVLFYAARAFWFDESTPRGLVAVSLLGALIHWRVMMLPVDVLLRHNEPEARLVHAGDIQAVEVRRLATWLLGVIALSLATLRTFLMGGVPIATVQFLALVVGLANAVLAFYFVERLRVVEAPAMAGENRHSTVLERVWHPLALIFIFAALIAWILGVIADDLAVFWAFIYTGGILLAVMILQSALAAWLARWRPAGAEDLAMLKRARWGRLMRRCVGLALWLVAGVLVVEIWMEPLARFLPAASWRADRSSVVSAAITLFVAYALWQVVFMHTERQPLMPGNAEENAGMIPVASRIQTMMPVLRIFMLITIGLLAALIVLSDLGVNTTSLIAGASIFGLAVSFGSQSLVHDIVSGIFFMADDAFRIGEYIDTGKAKGTVEGMSVRSLRLRHQNGQIHVIPFGQIQQVTNFSRDWTTVKFNLRLTLNTDLEKVRKTVKQIGAEMMKDPTLAGQLLEPLKMQGVTEIDPQGLVVRLKFTAHPAQPTLIQREALRRIAQQFRERNIEFANANILLQGATGVNVSEEPQRSQPQAAPAQIARTRS